MPMNRALYPDDWELRARRVKQRAKWRCQACGKRCRRPGEPFESHRWTLTAAHRDHDPENPHARLIALCATCHLRYDNITRRNPDQPGLFELLPAQEEEQEYIAFPIHARGLKG